MCVCAYIQRKRRYIYPYNKITLYIKCFIMRNWLVWWWSLRNPTVCHLPPGGLRKLVVSFQSDSEGLRVRGVDGISPSPRTEDPTQQLPPSLIQALSGLDDTHPPWRGPSALLSLLSHMLTSSRNTLKDTFRNNQISEFLTKYLSAL